MTIARLVRAIVIVGENELNLRRRDYREDALWAGPWSPGLARAGQNGLVAAKLGAGFFRQDVLAVAPALLGKWLCHRVGDEVRRGRITEVEAYRGEADTACHARVGRTRRTAVMYEPGGVAYVFLCYGVHHLFNVVTGEAGDPQAVLVRGLAGCSGPGRLTKALGINLSCNGADLAGDVTWLEDDGADVINPVATPRIGIGYASPEDQARLWRFTLPGPTCPSP
jgi:DNA-3-methyladenine glycosylase